MDFSRRLPIGIQDFKKIRDGGFIYVDKSEYIYNLIKKGAPYFLSRPRRFGKSLFLSTLRYYFEGRRELFEGLAIEELSKGDPEAFQEYPVFYFDLNKINFKAENALELVLGAHLDEWEVIYGDEKKFAPLEERFQYLIRKANDITGKQAVILVDEYDKPLLEGADSDMIEHNKAVFNGFFSTLKSYDRYIRFIFITGVTKFSKVSIFSDLNQLDDISLAEDYASICGITEQEMIRSFMPEIAELAVKQHMTEDACIAHLKKMYDGYHFHYDAAGVYNPFSLLNAFDKKEFGMYWFATGTPTFLIERVQKSNFDVKKITEGELYADEGLLTDYHYDSANPIPLFYQTGYLTIAGYDKKYRSYQLDYPNEEVKYGFMKSLSPLYLHDEDDINPLDVRAFGIDIERGNTDSLRDRFTELFARLPYPSDEKVLEQNFQNVIYIVFMLLGQFVQTEVHSSRGRADVEVETADLIYIFEFKRDRSAEEALSQIGSGGYADRYAADKRTLIKIGANFDSKERNLNGWTVEKTPK